MELHLVRKLFDRKNDHLARGKLMVVRQLMVEILLRVSR